MAASISLVDAAAALQDHFGPRLESGRDDGRDLMADVLRQQFSISRRESHTLVERLEQAHTIRWRTGDRPGEQGAAGGFVAGMGPGVSSPAGAGYTGQTLLPMGESGYWQLESPD